jgi:hypothetical protein
MDHETAFAKAFLRSEKRARFLQALARERRELLSRLGRDLPYLPEFAFQVPAARDFPEELEKLLRSRGAGPTCHVIAGELKADGRELPLREALHQVCLQPAGAILSCLPGRLAYYRPEAPGAGIILERPGAQ